MLTNRSGLLCCLIVLLISSRTAAQETRDQKVRADRERVQSDGFWIYNDLPKAFAEAERTGRPLLVGLRCIPCEECVKLDDHLVDTDPELRPLLEQFVCVRVVSTNGLDLDLFQYDTDQSFAMFMLNADRTIYGRFGTRSHRTEWIGDVSLPGLAKALRGALDLHADPSRRASLAGKTGRPLEFSSPEKYPSLKDRFTDALNYEGDVVKSCIHCHQIGDARRDFYRSQGKPIPEDLLFSYPHPRILGLVLNPDECATVKSVEPASIAETAGIRAGDRIQTLNGQPLLSIADIQWVLHQANADGGQLAAEVLSADSTTPKTITIALPPRWKQKDDLSWRASTWGLRRMVTGGLKLEEATAEERARLKIPDDRMALKVQHVGQYGAHAAAKRAGFQKGDVIVRFGDQDDFLTATSLLAFGATQTTPGEKVTVTVNRAGREIQLNLPMQP
ncbi:MAG: Trx7/PDZ domain-containing (seleno)protein [Planctomycetaceae bacterium]